MDSIRVMVCSWFMDLQQVNFFQRLWMVSFEVGFAYMDISRHAKLWQTFGVLGVSLPLSVWKRHPFSRIFWIGGIVTGKQMSRLSLRIFPGAAKAWVFGFYKTAHPP